MILVNKLRDINIKIFQKKNILSLIILIITFTVDRFTKIEILENLVKILFMLIITLI